MLKWSSLFKQSGTKCLGWMKPKKYGVSVDNINPHMKNIEYALLGSLVMRAVELKKEVKKGTSNKKFNEVLSCTAGDNQGGGQKPLTFLRQVLALCTYPQLFQDSTLPDDAKERAQRILDGCVGNSIGAYGYQKGIDVVREDIVKYIEHRDKISADIDNIFVTTGASEGMDYMMHLVSSTKSGNQRAGVMMHMPTYPLYLAYNSRYDNHVIKCYSDEENNWKLSKSELERSYNEGLKHSVPKLIVAINPGNPTGNVWNRSDIETIILFAKEKGLTVLADEVYQQNVYGDHEFVSFKRVLHDLGPEYSDVEMVSLMSASKGIFGECGLRCGYLEMTNIPAETKQLLETNLSLRTCPSITGQAAMDIVVNPPKEGDISYELFEKESSSIFNDLQSKARFMTKKLNEIPGYSCTELTGAIYAFPKIEIPPKIIQAAKENGQAPDKFYCRLLLETSGVCVVPGSSFVQAPGTNHVRISLSSSLDVLERVMEKITAFQEEFMR